MRCSFSKIAESKSCPCHLCKLGTLITFPRAPRPSDSARSLPGPCSALRTGAAPDWSTLPAHLLSDWPEPCWSNPQELYGIMAHFFFNQRTLFKSQLSPRTIFASLESKVLVLLGLFHKFAPRPRREWGGGLVKAGVEGVGVVSEVLRWLRTRPGHHYHQH